MYLRRKWQSTPVFLPGESQGRGGLEGRRLWGRTESNMTESDAAAAAAAAAAADFLFMASTDDYILLVGMSHPFLHL